jgi:hypothetical protein
MLEVDPVKQEIGLINAKKTGSDSELMLGGLS